MLSVPPISRSVAYLDWAFSMPGSATYDLTQSGMPDAVTNVEVVARAAAAFDARASLDRSRAAEILEAFRGQVGRHYGIAPRNVVPTLGTSGAITQALLALARPGDDIVVERPAYEPLWRIPRCLGMNVTPLERTFDGAWQVLPDRLARLLTPRTRLVVLSNLHNPTGAPVAPGVIAEVADLARRVGANVFVDEVYLPFVPGASKAAGKDGASDSKPRSGVHVADNVVVAASMTKVFGLGALRAGWLACQDPEVVSALERAAQFLHVVPPLPAFDLAGRLWDHASVLLERARTLSAEGLRTLRRFLESQDRVRCAVPDFGLCAALVLPPAIRADVLVEHLHRRYDTLVVPGTFFEAPGLVRVGVGVPPRQLEQGLANLVAAIEDLEA